VKAEAILETLKEDVMRAIVSWLSGIAVAGLVLLPSIARADEKKIEADKLPRKVKVAIKERFPGCEITSAEKETEDGKVVYDIELKHKGRKYEMDIHEDGTIIEIEKEVDAKDLPEAVKKALEEKYPKSTIKEIMEVNKVKGKEETPDHYEILITTADNKKLEVTVGLDGKNVKGGKAEGDKD
jgi:hypothetical protein